MINHPAPKFQDNSLFITSFSTLKDYRRTGKGNIKFSLNEIIFLTISAVVSGFTTYELIAQYGEYEIDWLRKYFPYKKGTPSHDTLGEFYANINPKEFADCMITFMKSLKNLDSELISLDGKTVRGYQDQDGYPLHILTAFCEKNKMTLGEDIVQGKENEIVAIPRLLKLLSIEGCLISIDAIGCQTKIASQIVEQGADYLLQVKSNQKALFEEIEDTFMLSSDLETSISEEIGHGRIETRKCSVIRNLQDIEQKDKWAKLSSIIKIESEVCNKKTGEISKSERYYISSKTETPGYFLTNARGHWGIESFHWSLDVVYNEDFQAKRNKNGILNFNTLSKCAISLLVEEKSFKKSKPLKQHRALAQRDYRELILNI